jgi:hypothetical protein
MRELKTRRWSVRLSTIVILVLCLSLSLAGVLAGASGVRAADTDTWTRLPLDGGPVSWVAIDPLNPSTLYTQGPFGSFLSRSLDGGNTWTGIDSDAYAWGILSFAIDPLTPTTLYAGTAGGGLIRSTDSGTTWKVIDMGRGEQGVDNLAINPVTPSILYASTHSSDPTTGMNTDGGVSRSTDGGDTWTAVNTGLTDKGVGSLAIDPRTPTTLYAGTLDGAFRSTDSGAHWVALALKTGFASVSGRVISLVINPITPTILSSPLSLTPARQPFCMQAPILVVSSAPRTAGHTGWRQTLVSPVMATVHSTSPSLPSTLARLPPYTLAPMSIMSSVLRTAEATGRR